MELSDAAADLLLVGVAALVVLLTVVVLAQSRALRAIRTGRGPRRAITTTPPDEASSDAGLAVSRLGLVRYDAFTDTGGLLSFSAAMLDPSGRGIVFTAINGRTEGRMYARPILNGDSPTPLSDEEREAITQAMSGGDHTATVEAQETWRTVKR